VIPANLKDEDKKLLKEMVKIMTNEMKSWNAAQWWSVYQTTG
jgi:hypothetical protein